MCNQGAASGTERLSQKWQKTVVPLCASMSCYGRVAAGFGSKCRMHEIECNPKRKIYKRSKPSDQKQNKGISQAGANHLENI